MRGLCTFSSSFSRFPCFPIFLRIDVNGGSLEALSPDDSHTYSRVEARPACEQRHVRDQNASCNLRSRSWAGKQETRYRPHAESSSHCLLQLRAKFPVLNAVFRISFENSNFDRSYYSSYIIICSSMSVSLVLFSIFRYDSF